MSDRQVLGATPSTWPEDRPVIDLHRDGQSSPHPSFAHHAVTEVGPGAGKQMVHAHVRAGRPVKPHFRSRPDTSGNASDPMAPHTNAEPMELYKGKGS
jgi:hypothetical protein